MSELNSLGNWDSTQVWITEIPLAANPVHSCEGCRDQVANSQVASGMDWPGVQWVVMGREEGSRGLCLHLGKAAAAKQKCFPLPSSNLFLKGGKNGLGFSHRNLLI